MFRHVCKVSLFVVTFVRNQFGKTISWLVVDNSLCSKKVFLFINKICYFKFYEHRDKSMLFILLL